MAKATRLSDFSSDHDILIELKATVANNHANVVNKLQEMQADIKDVQVGSNATLMEHERRIRLMEEMLLKFDPPAAGIRLETVYQWMVDTQRDGKRDRARIGLIFGGITVLFNLVSWVIDHWTLLFKR